MNEDLRKWFGDGKEGDWVRVGTDGKIKGDCAREPGEGKPKCMPRSKAHSMGKDARATAARRKRREDPVADRKGKGNKPVMVNTEEFIPEGNEPTNPALWSKAKSLAKKKFDVYPSAYANGWAAKYYKSKGGGWKSVSEEAIDEKCWDGYKRVGMKKKGKRMVPNCVPEARDIIEKAKSKTRQDLPWEEDPKNPTRKVGVRKDQYGNTIKNVTKHLAKKAMKAYEETTGNVKEELGKDNEWGTDALRKKYAKATPGQEGLAADKIPTFDPRYDNVTTQYAGLSRPVSEGYLAEISAKGAVARDKFKKRIQKVLSDPKSINRAKKVVAKQKTAAKAAEAPHLVMQLRKVVSIGSKVQFQDGQHHNIAPNHADRFMSKYNSARTSIEKEALQKRAHKSHPEFMKAIAEEILDESNNTPHVRPHMDTTGKQSGWKSSNKHGKVKYFGKDFKKSAEKHAGISEESEKVHSDCGTPDCCQTCETAVHPHDSHSGTGERISPVMDYDDDDIRFQEFDENEFEEQLEADINAMTWDDLVDFYDDDELEYIEDDEEELEEGITPQGRLKKKFAAMRTKTRRNMARSLALKRVSTPARVKARSVRAARRMVYKRLLRNRDIKTVSAAEKTRLEAQVKRMAPMVARLSVRALPQIRKLEQSRLKNRNKKKK